MYNYFQHFFMIERNDWWTSPTESENGRLIMVSGRRDIDKFRNNPRFSIRVEISWKYTGITDGMPDDPTSKIMEAVTEALKTVFAKDPVAVMTGIYTGDDRRDWIFYTASTHIFGRKVNEALAQFDLLPIEIYTENDPDWAEYTEMKELSEIVPES